MGKDNISMLEELLKKKQQELAASSEQANANVVDGEKLFAASVAANEDHWVEYLINPNLPLQKQLDRLNLWLDVHKPSHIYRSSRVGWIAVKFRDKKKKVPEAKKAWENLKDQFRHNSTINRLAREFGVVGGKWMCHMPVRLIDDVWSKLAIALVNGKLGSSVFMVKVSPVEDMDETVSNGDHVIVVYNTNYKDVDQILEVESQIRCVGVTSIMKYKPDIYSTLGIYRKNKWGFRPTTFVSVIESEGSSKVDAVLTGMSYENMFVRPSAKERLGVTIQPNVKNRLGQANEPSPTLKVKVDARLLLERSNLSNPKKKNNRDVKRLKNQKAKNSSNLGSISKEKRNPSLKDRLKPIQSEEDVSSSQKEVVTEIVSKENMDCQRTDAEPPLLVVSNCGVNSSRSDAVLSKVSVEGNQCSLEDASEMEPEEKVDLDEDLDRYENVGDMEFLLDESDEDMEL